MSTPQQTHDEAPLTSELNDAKSTEAINEPIELEHWIWIRLRIFVTFFLLYVVSIGPCYWLWYESRFLDAPIWFAVFYEPLFKLCSIIPWLGYLIDAYIKWWII